MDLIQGANERVIGLLSSGVANPPIGPSAWDLAGKGIRSKGLESRSGFASCLPSDYPCRGNTKLQHETGPRAEC